MRGGFLYTAGFAAGACSAGLIMVLALLNWGPKVWHNEIACVIPTPAVAYQDSLSLKYKAGEIATADEINVRFRGAGYTLELSGPQARFLAMVVALDGLK